MKIENNNENQELNSTLTHVVLFQSDFFSIYIDMYPERCFRTLQVFESGGLSERLY